MPGTDRRAATPAMTIGVVSAPGTRRPTAAPRRRALWRNPKARGPGPEATTIAPELGRRRGSERPGHRPGCEPSDGHEHRDLHAGSARGSGAGGAVVPGAGRLRDPRIRDPDCGQQRDRQRARPRPGDMGRPAGFRAVPERTADQHCPRSERWHCRGTRTTISPSWTTIWRLPPDWLANAVETMERTGADVLLGQGGPRVRGRRRLGWRATGSGTVVWKGVPASGRRDRAGQTRGSHPGSRVGELRAAARHYPAWAGALRPCIWPSRGRGHGFPPALGQAWRRDRVLGAGVDDRVRARRPKHTRIPGAPELSHQPAIRPHRREEQPTPARSPCAGTWPRASCNSRSRFRGTAPPELTGADPIRGADCGRGRARQDSLDAM